MDTPVTQLDLLIDLESRNDDLLLRLDELDNRVERTLAECQVYRANPSSSDRGGPTC